MSRKNRSASWNALNNSVSRSHDSSAQGLPDCNRSSSNPVEELGVWTGKPVFCEVIFVKGWVSGQDGSFAENMEEWDVDFSIGNEDHLYQQKRYLLSRLHIEEVYAGSTHSDIKCPIPVVPWGQEFSRKVSWHQGNGLIKFKK